MLEKVNNTFQSTDINVISPGRNLSILTEDNIWVKRPGTGEIKAKHYREVLGLYATRDIKNDEHLNWSDFR